MKIDPVELITPSGRLRCPAVLQFLSSVEHECDSPESVVRLAENIISELSRVIVLHQKEITKTREVMAERSRGSLQCRDDLNKATAKIARLESQLAERIKWHNEYQQHCCDLEDQLRAAEDRVKELEVDHQKWATDILVKEGVGQYSGPASLVGLEGVPAYAITSSAYAALTGIRTRRYYSITWPENAKIDPVNTEAELQAVGIKPDDSEKSRKPGGIDPSQPVIWRNYTAEYRPLTFAEWAMMVSNPEYWRLEEERLRAEAEFPDEEDDDDDE